MLPTVRIGELKVSRLIVGGNPFSGNSHVSYEKNDEMEAYMSVDRIKDTLFRCMEQGINAAQMRGDRHILRIVREFRQEGGRMHWIAQTASEIAPFEGSVNSLLRFPVCAPDAIYLHGTTVDAMFKAGEYGEIRRRLAFLRATGLPAGLATHMPEVMEYSEEHGWDVDFYMACVYNISRIDRVSSAVTGRETEGEPFFDEDIPIMYRTIRAVGKPCLAFKILGATRRCQTQDNVRAAFAEAFASIKPSDAVVVGMFPKERDEVALNTLYARQAMP